jgi:hypothetical protein
VARTSLHDRLQSAKAPAPKGREALYQAPTPTASINPEGEHTRLTVDRKRSTPADERWEDSHTRVTFCGSSAAGCRAHGPPRRDAHVPGSGREEIVENHLGRAFVKLAQQVVVQMPMSAPSLIGTPPAPVAPAAGGPVSPSTPDATPGQ